MRILASALALSALATMAIVGCTSGSSGGGGSSEAALTVSGAFSNATMNVMKRTESGKLLPMAATDYVMVCAMLVDPYTSGSSALGNDGSFSFSIAGASGKPIGCFLTKSGAIAAVFEFAATSDSFSGATGGSTYTPKADSTTLTFPTNLTISNGVVSVPTTDVAENGSSTSTQTWADPTGTWDITGFCSNGYDKTTGGYKSQCQGAASEDEMPTSVYVKQISATKDSETRYGMSIWKDEASRTACGGVEGAVDLGLGWTANGGWNSAFTHHTAVDLSSTSAVTTAAGKAKAQVYDGTTVCGKSVASPGTTKCSDIDFTGGAWGMTADACKLYCVINALNNESGYDFSPDTCPVRYRAQWHNMRELMSDRNFGSGSVSAGAFSSGACSSGFDGCANASSDPSIVLIEVSKEQGPKNRFEFGELFINGNVGTLIRKEHFRSNFRANSGSGGDDCGGTRISKLTFVQDSATAATVTLENTFVPDVSNAGACETNMEFLRNANSDDNKTIKLSKR